MSRGYCPLCNELVTITPDRVIAEGFSARFWRVSDHEKICVTDAAVVTEVRTLPNMIIVVERCEGSGRLI